MKIRGLMQCDVCGEYVLQKEINPVITYGGLLATKPGPGKWAGICDACLLFYSKLGYMCDAEVFPKFMTKEILE